MNVFITGGCGFIGSHLAERLVQGRTNAMVKTRATDEVRDVVHAARREVVEDRDRVASLEKPLGQV